MSLEMDPDVVEVASEAGSEVGAVQREQENVEAEGLLSQIERSAAQTSKSKSHPSKKRRQNAEEEDFLREIRDSMKTNTHLLSQLVGDKCTSPREPFINYVADTLRNLPDHDEEDHLPASESSHLSRSLLSYRSQQPPATSPKAQAYRVGTCPYIVPAVPPVPAATATVTFPVSANSRVFSANSI